MNIEIVLLTGLYLQSSDQMDQLLTQARSLRILHVDFVQQVLMVYIL